MTKLKDVDVYHPPLSDELSEDEIQYLVSYLWGFLSALTRCVNVLHPEIQPFFRHIDSSHVIYGYWDGKFVEEVIEDPEEYQRVVQTLEQQYGETALSDAEQVSRIRDMIEGICST